MTTLNKLIKRNTKLFFKDKGLFFVSLITPLILLVLYATFLGNVYKSTFINNLPEEIEVSNKIINGLVGGELFSSLLAVCCITVAFCANMLMVQDKITGARKDLLISPLKKSTLAISYYISTLINTLIICLFATIANFIYLAGVGWFLSFKDCLFIFIDVFLLSMFGTVLSSIVNNFLSTQGQVSAVGTIVSSIYGFICGAYMPISSFGLPLQRVLMFLPGTYGTSLLRNHAMQGVFNNMLNNGFSLDVINSIKDAVDCNIYFFDKSVSIGAMYGIIIGSVIILLGIYVLINIFNVKRGEHVKSKCKK